MHMSTFSWTMPRLEGVRPVRTFLNESPWCRDTIVRYEYNAWLSLAKGNCQKPLKACLFQTSLIHAGVSKSCYWLNLRAGMFSHPLWNQFWTKSLELVHDYKEQLLNYLWNRNQIPDSFHLWRCKVVTAFWPHMALFSHPKQPSRGCSKCLLLEFPSHTDNTHPSGSPINWKHQFPGKPQGKWGLTPSTARTSSLMSIFRHLCMSDNYLESL